MAVKAGVCPRYITVVCRFPMTNNQKSQPSAPITERKRWLTKGLSPTTKEGVVAQGACIAEALKNKRTKRRKLRDECT